MPADSPDSKPAQSVDHESSVIDTVQSLIIAFVLAMTFRGFVTEGFVIPTGSMAPTLLGQHMLIHSTQTGYDFPVGLDDPRIPPRNVANSIVDPMIGPRFNITPSPGELVKRMGDRILVLKCLYPFCMPHRFDVVVFKNPTDPTGEAANYIKRLIGLPDEQIWLADGDVFARPVKNKQFVIQRKPEYVQRAVWQMVHDSDYIPMYPDRLDEHYPGPPWVQDAHDWDLSGRSYICSTSKPTTLRWDNTRRQITDWTAYDMPTYGPGGRTLEYPVSDIRVSASVVAQQPGFKTTFELQARKHVFQYIIGDGKAVMRMRPENDINAWTERSANVTLPEPGEVFNVEFWHSDQAMRLFINGERVMDALEYDWSPVERLTFASGNTSAAKDNDIDDLINSMPLQPQVRWTFEGSPVTLHHVRLDRDLHYRRDNLEPTRQQRNQPMISGPAFGTNPERNPAVLGHDQFMMCGDNSQMSLDSRLWGSPHPLIASQIDPSPFIVNRKLLLGKAWVVYFPAPFPVSSGGTPFIPDFGRLRFIR